MRNTIVVIAVFVCLLYGFGASAAAGFIRRDGSRLMLQGREIVLRGVCFGNEVWGNPSLPPKNHHNETDFKRLKDMNINAVRFYLNYKLFEEDAKPYKYKETGFAWLDKNIAWARKYGIYLILNIHVPQGGFQSNGEGMALWTDRKNQLRLIGLWKVIAKRYMNEPVIAGYDLLNEPVTLDSTGQWQSLAGELVAGIRSVDRNHLLIVERTNGVKNAGDAWSQLNFFSVADDNVMYTFHFYQPFEFSHQNASWTGQGDGGRYPDPDVIAVPSDLTWYRASDNKTLSTGDTDWSYIQGKRFKVTDSKMIVGKPALVSARNQGTVYFDDIMIEEFDENGILLKRLFEINPESTTGWYGWSQNGSGTFNLSDIGHGDHASLSIKGTTGDANFTGDRYRFRVTKGHSYAISGWMKGEGITSRSCYLRLDFETSPSGSSVSGRDRSYLEASLLRYLEWGKTHNVPMYVGEWGLYKDCFAEGKGGLNWVGDMLDLFQKYNVSFTYHAYHEDAFGIYKTNGLPNNSSANTGIIKLLREKLSRMLKQVKNE